MKNISESKRLMLETRYKKELNVLLEKAINQRIYTGRVDEGVWDSIKHGLAKLTSLRKMLPSAKRAEAEKQIQAIIDRADAASNKAFAELSKTLKAAGYPNQKSADEFLAQTMEIGKIYDSIVASAEAGETDPAVANEMIKDLRKMMQYYMDYELESVYKRLSEAEGDAQGQSADKAGPLSGDTKTMSMEELRSTLAPKLLGLSGLAGIVAGVLMHTDWFYNLVMKTNIVDMRQSVIEEFKQSLNRTLQVQPGEGPTQALGRFFFGDAKHYKPNTPLSELLNDMKEFGLTDEDLATLGRGDATDQSVWLDNWKNFQKDPSQSLAKIFGAKGRKEIPWDVDPKKMVNITDTITTTVVKTIGHRFKRTALTGIGAMIGAKGLGVASVLLPAVGVALVTSGAAVYFLRKHGQKYSRLATLDGLLQRMVDVDPSKIKGKSPLADNGPDDGGSDGGDKKSGGDGEVIHIYRKGPHKFIGRGKKEMNLVDKLMGGPSALPRWAVKDVTNRIKQELENKGFVVKEGFDIANLLEKKKKKKKKEKPRNVADAVPATRSDTTRTGGGERAARATMDTAARVGPAMDRDVAGPGDNRGKIARMVIEFGSDTTVVKDGKTLRFSRKQLFDKPDEFIAALSPEEKALLMRLPEDPQRERSKFDFFKMTTDQRKELYLKMKQGKVDFEKEFRNQPKAKELATDKFFMSDLRDILETGHTAHGEQPIDPEIIRNAMEVIRDYLSDYLDDAGIVMRETVELNRWSVLAGIKTILRG